MPNSNSMHTSQWHRSSCQPSTSFSGDRFPPFAMSGVKNRMTRRFEKFQAARFKKSSSEMDLAPNAVRAGVWANVHVDILNPQPFSSPLQRSRCRCAVVADF
jgi:hypothetical protein